jgi:non-ribosomal peptide synthetase component F
VLVLVIHHIVTDGWSMRILTRELARIYGACVEGREIPLSDLPVQYADWAAWQRSWLSGGEMESQLDYWRRELGGLEPLDLPTDRPRAARRGLRGASLSFEIDAGDAAALLERVREERATLFHGLLACFQALLARQAAQEEVVVGTPLANRTILDAEPIVGLFANTLPLRARVDPDASLRALIAQVRDRTLETVAHQDAPFERIVDAVAPDRDLARNPVFDCMFVFRHAEEGDAASGLTVEPLPAETGATPFDLTLVMAESDGRIFGSLIHDADLFEDRTAARLVERFRAIVHALASEPDRLVGELDLLTAAERAALESINVPGPALCGRTVDEIVGERARLAPDDPAILDEEGALTYGELDSEADRIARALAAAGAGAETGVGLLAGRTRSSIAGMMGIFRSGGVLVPLDASLPPARIAAMIRDAGIRAVLCERGMESVLPAPAPRLVRIDAPDPDDGARGPT